MAQCMDADGKEDKAAKRDGQPLSLTGLFRDGANALKGEVLLDDDGNPVVPWTYFATWLVLGLAFGTAVGFGLLRMRKTTEAQVFMEDTCRLLERHIGVTRVMGSPLEATTAFQGTFQYDLAEGSFEVAGPPLQDARASSVVAARVTVHAVSNPAKGQLDWTYQQLDVDVPRRKGSLRIRVTDGVQLVQDDDDDDDADKK